jgi:hypothetical protein
VSESSPPPKPSAAAAAASNAQAISGSPFAANGNEHDEVIDSDEAPISQAEVVAGRRVFEASAAAAAASMKPRRDILNDDEDDDEDADLPLKE